MVVVGVGGLILLVSFVHVVIVKVWRSEIANIYIVEVGEERQ